MGGNDEITLSCLQHAIEDTQGSIRAYDAKAEVLGILLTLALGLTNFSLFIDKATDLSIGLLGTCWIVGLIALLQLGTVLHPQKNLFKPLVMGSFIPKGTYFLVNVTSTPISDLISKAQSTDWIAELTYENVKLSLIRDYKHCRFIRSLYLSGVVLLFIIATVMCRLQKW